MTTTYKRYLEAAEDWAGDVLRGINARNPEKIKAMREAIEGGGFLTLRSSCVGGHWIDTALVVVGPRGETTELWNVDDEPPDYRER